MSIFKLLGAATALVLIAGPAMAQEVIYEPGYCAFYYPNANCQNNGPGNPYTLGYAPRVSQAVPVPAGGQTVGVSRSERTGRPRIRSDDGLGLHRRCSASFALIDGPAIAGRRSSDACRDFCSCAKPGRHRTNASLTRLANVNSISPRYQGAGRKLREFCFRSSFLAATRPMDSTGTHSFKIASASRGGPIRWLILGGMLLIARSRSARP